MVTIKIISMCPKFKQFNFKKLKFYNSYKYNRVTIFNKDNI